MRCQREVGRPGNWHECERPAVVGSEREINRSVYTLHYCARHAHCAHGTGSPSVFIRRVYELGSSSDPMCNREVAA